MENRIYNLENMVTKNGNCLIKFDDKNIGYFDKFDNLICTTNILDWNNLVELKTAEKSFTVISPFTSSIRKNVGLIEFYNSIGCHRFYGNVFGLVLEKNNINFSLFNVTSKQVFELHTTPTNIMYLMMYLEDNNRAKFDDILSKMVAKGIELHSLKCIGNLDEHALLILIHSIISVGDVSAFYFHKTYNLIEFKRIVSELTSKLFHIKHSTKFSHKRHIKLIISTDIDKKTNKHTIDFMSTEGVWIKIKGVDKTYHFTFDSNLGIFVYADVIGQENNDLKPNRVNAVLEYLNGKDFITKYKAIRQ